MNPLPPAIASTDDFHPIVFVEPRFAERFRRCLVGAGFEPLIDSGLCGVCDLTAFRFDREVDVERIAGWFNDIVGAAKSHRADDETGLAPLLISEARRIKP